MECTKICVLAIQETGVKQMHVGAANVIRFRHQLCLQSGRGTPQRSCHLLWALVDSVCCACAEEAGGLFSTHGVRRDVHVQSGCINKANCLFRFATHSTVKPHHNEWHDSEISIPGQQARQGNAIISLHNKHFRSNAPFQQNFSE